MAEVEIVEGEMQIPSEAETTPLSLKSLLQSPGGVSVAAARDWASRRRQSVRGWTEFLNAARFKVPASVPRLSRRLMRNIDYFQSNYLILFIALAIFCLLTSPLLLVMVAASLLACHYVTQRHAQHPISIMGRQLSVGQLYAVVGVVSLPIFVWAGAGAAVFWVIGASCVLTTLHAAFYNIEALQGAEDPESFDLVMEEV